MVLTPCNKGYQGENWYVVRGSIFGTKIFHNHILTKILKIPILRTNVIERMLYKRGEKICHPKQGLQERKLQLLR